MVAAGFGGVAGRSTGCVIQFPLKILQLRMSWSNFFIRRRMCTDTGNISFLLKFSADSIAFCVA